MGRICWRCYGSPCRCNDPSESRCKCGWHGSKMVTKGKRTFLRLSCPKCQRCIVKLERRHLDDIYEATGKTFADHYPLIGSVVGKFFIRSQDLSERVQHAASYGLVVAAIKFDKSLGLQFTTFAVRTMRGYAQHAIRDWKREQVGFDRYCADRVAQMKEEYAHECEFV